MDTLMDTAAGRYTIVTASGTSYLIDLDAETLTRDPAVHAPDLAIADASESMRRDGDTVKLVSIRACTVGRPAMFIVDLGVDGVAATARMTTTVVDITAA